MKHILIVENEMKLVKLMIPFLKDEGFLVLITSKGSDVLPLLQTHKIDCILLDVMLDDLDGWRVLRDIRSQYTIPVIMLTARSDASDIQFGLELGANDYVTKPFQMKDLVIKLKQTFEHKTLKKSFEFFKGNYEMFVHQKKISLTKIEHDLLAFLLENQSQVVTRETLLIHVWGFLYQGDTRAIDTAVKRLRQKLKPLDIIKTVFGVGYKIEVLK